MNWIFIMRYIFNDRGKYIMMEFFVFFLKNLWVRVSIFLFVFFFDIIIIDDEKWYVKDNCCN